MPGGRFKGRPRRRDHRCSSRTCAAQHRESLYHFVSRGAFNIEGLGPKIIDKFLDEGLISDAADILSLERGYRRARSVRRKVGGEYRNRSAEKKKVTLPRFLYSLGILHVGEETAITLSRNFPISKRNFRIKINDILKRSRNFARRSPAGCRISGRRLRIASTIGFVRRAIEICGTACLGRCGNRA